jgi:hypothetical protein
MIRHAARHHRRPARSTTPPTARAARRGGAVPPAPAARRHDGQQGGADAGARLGATAATARALQLPRRRRLGRAPGTKAAARSTTRWRSSRRCAGPACRWRWAASPSAAMSPSRRRAAAPGSRSSAWCWWARRENFTMAAVPPTPWWCTASRRRGAAAATLDWARPQALPVTVLPGVGHFFHGQLPLLNSIVAAGTWHADPSLSPGSR